MNVIGVYMYNIYKQQNSFSCVTHGTDKHFYVCNIYVRLHIFPCVTYTAGYFYSREMTWANLIYERYIITFFS